jgi:hypothetical protein
MGGYLMKPGLPVVDGVAGMGLGIAPRAPLTGSRPAPRIRTVEPQAWIPHVVAWNLTQRCNLACAHCYIAAGSWHSAATELTTAECMRIADEILSISPAPMFILSGGEPLLRTDLEDIAEHATAGGATVVVGTNGTRLTRERIRSLKGRGRDRRRGERRLARRTLPRPLPPRRGALRDTLAAVDRLARGGARLRRADLAHPRQPCRARRPRRMGRADRCRVVQPLLPRRDGSWRGHGRPLARRERGRAAGAGRSRATVPRPHAGPLQVPAADHAARARADADSPCSTTARAARAACTTAASRPRAR